MEERFYNLREAAEELGIALNTLKGRIKERGIEPIESGRKKLISSAHLEEIRAKDTKIRVAPNITQQSHQQQLEKLSVEIDSLKRENRMLLDRVEYFEKLTVNLTNSLTDRLAEIKKDKSDFANQKKEDWKDIYLTNDVTEGPIKARRPKVAVRKTTAQETSKKAAPEKLTESTVPANKDDNTVIIENFDANWNLTESIAPVNKTKVMSGAKKHNHYKQPLKENAIREAIAEKFPEGIPKRVEKDVRNQINEKILSGGYSVTTKYLSDIISRMRKELES